MEVTLWGARGSVATPGADTARFGGNTSCVEVRGDDGTILILDAGTGIRRLGAALAGSARRVDLLLTHLHMDHIQGLGFFSPLRIAEAEVHIWGPASATMSLASRLTRYLSPPLFPVHLRDLPCKLVLHEVPCSNTEIGEFTISSAMVCHPGPTVGYRIAGPGATLAYLPDHEPALGTRNFPMSGDWTSGYEIAANVDLLIHDAQYNGVEYAERVGWGHSTVRQAFEFAALVEARHLVPFHHDPSHSDEYLDHLFAETANLLRWPFAVTPGMEGAKFTIGSKGSRVK